MKRQAAMFLVTLVACLAAAAATAQAAPPIIERVPIDDQFRDEDSCAFPVQVHVTGFLVHIEWVAQDGDVRFVEASPQLKLTLTNLDTGGNHHGQRLWALHVTQNADGGFTAVETGLWGRLENPKTGERGMFQSAGRRVISVDQRATNPTGLSVG
jgi:hypothetical protein